MPWIRHSVFSSRTVLGQLLSRQGRKVCRPTGGNRLSGWMLPAASMTRLLLLAVNAVLLAQWVRFCAIGPAKAPRTLRRLRCGAGAGHAESCSRRRIRAARHFARLMDQRFLDPLSSEGGGPKPRLAQTLSGQETCVIDQRGPGQRFCISVRSAMSSRYRPARISSMISKASTDQLEHVPPSLSSAFETAFLKICVDAVVEAR